MWSGCVISHCSQESRSVALLRCLPRDTVRTEYSSWGTASNTINLTLFNTLVLLKPEAVMAAGEGVHKVSFALCYWAVRGRGAGAWSSVAFAASRVLAETLIHKMANAKERWTISKGGCSVTEFASCEVQRTCQQRFVQKQLSFISCKFPYFAGALLFSYFSLHIFGAE